MTNVLLRFAAVAAAVVLVQGAAGAQELPAPLPWGSTGAQVAAALEAKELPVVLTRAGRDVHAASRDRHTQAIAILRSDSLVGLIYFHPENALQNAASLFSAAAAQAERAHGPPTCRKTDLAVWPLERGILEVRLRRPSGDGAPGAEIRYIGPGYAEEMAHRTTARPSTSRRPASPARASSGRRLLGTAVDSVPAPAAADSAVAAPVDAAAPAAPAPSAPSAASACTGA